MKRKLFKVLAGAALSLGLFTSAMTTTVEAAGNNEQVYLEDNCYAYSVAYVSPYECSHAGIVYEGSGTRYSCSNSVYHLREDIEIWYCGGCNSQLELVVDSAYEEHDLRIYASGSYTAKCADCNYEE